MRGQEITVKIRTQYDDEGARAFERALGSLQQQVGSAAQSALSLSSNFSGVASLFGAGAVGGVVGGILVAGAAAFANALANAAQSAIDLGASMLQASMRMQQMQMGIVAVLSSWYDLRDAQGRVLTGVERYNALLGMSRALMQEIRNEANRTILSTQELIELVQTSIGFTFGKGLTEQQTVKFVSAVAQYGRMMGMPTPMIMQEIRALTGAAPLRTSQIALALGIVQQEVEQSGEAFYNALMSKFGALADLAEQAESRLDTQWSTLQSNLEQILADLGGGLEKAIAGLLAQINRMIEQLNKDRVFERLGWIIGAALQSLINLISDWINEANRFISRIMMIANLVINALRSAIDNALNRLGVVGNWIRERLNWIGQAASTVWSLTPFGYAAQSGANIGSALRGLWYLSGLMITQGGEADIRATRRKPPAADTERRRAAERERQRLLHERQEAERIMRELATQNARAAWDALYGTLDTETAIWVVPLMEALEAQIAAEDAGKILARIEANTSQVLRDALAQQAFETQRRIQQELAGRREAQLAVLQAREQEAAQREAERRRSLQRAAMRTLYGALGMEDALLRMDYNERLQFYQEAGFGIFAPALAGLEVYLPVYQRRQAAQERSQAEFVEMLREQGEAARAQRQQALERQLKRGLISPVAFVGELRRLYQTQPLPEGALGAFEGALLEEVQARLPEQGLFESVQAYRDRWLQALQDLKTAYGQWLENLLHPEQFAQVMEGFDALAIEFEQRFIDRVQSRWKRFVQGLADNLQSGIGNAMVSALDRVMRDVRSAGDALRDLFSNIFAMIRQTVAQIIYERVFKQLIERLVDILFRAFGVGGSGGGGGGGKITLGSVLASIGIGLLTGWLGNIFGLQSGGRVGAGRAYLIGERGAELFVPQSDGVIYPHAYLRKMIQPAQATSGATIMVYVNDTGDIDLARRIARAIERLR